MNHTVEPVAPSIKEADDETCQSIYYKSCVSHRHSLFNRQSAAAAGTRLARRAARLGRRRNSPPQSALAVECGWCTASESFRRRTVVVLYCLDDSRCVCLADDSRMICDAIINRITGNLLWAIIVRLTRTASFSWRCGHPDGLGTTRIYRHAHSANLLLGYADSDAGKGVNK